MDSPNLPIPAPTIQDLCDQRDKALRLYAESQDLFKVAVDKFEQAAEAAKQATRGTATGLKLSEWRPHKILGTDFLPACQDQLDRDMWRHLMESTKLSDVMDREARDKLRVDLETNLQPATYENVIATLETMILGAGDMLRRGVVNMFQRLDRKHYKTNSAFRIGNKIIFNYLFDAVKPPFTHQWMSGYKSKEELIDLERMLFVIDRKAPPTWSETVVEKISQHLRTADSEDRFVSTVYLDVKWFKKGSCHVIIRDPEMVARINRLIAEHYGEALPDETRKANPFKPAEPKARSFSGKREAFYTPQDIAKYMTYLVGIKAWHAVLEPSCGDGALIEAVLKAGASKVVAYEVDHDAAAKAEDRIRALGIQANVSIRGTDFLKTTPVECFDRVIMNPPFGDQVSHFFQAYRFLKKGGIMIAVMSAGVEFRKEQEYVALRDLVGAVGGYIEKLPADTFKDSGTDVHTVLVTARKV